MTREKRYLMSVRANDMVKTAYATMCEMFYTELGTGSEEYDKFYPMVHVDQIVNCVLRNQLTDPKHEASLHSGLRKLSKKLRKHQSHHQDNQEFPLFASDLTHLYTNPDGIRRYFMLDIFMYLAKLNFPLEQPIV